MHSAKNDKNMTFSGKMVEFDIIILKQESQTQDKFCIFVTRFYMIHKSIYTQISWKWKGDWQKQGD